MIIKILSINEDKCDIPIYSFDLIGEGIVWRCVTPGFTSSSHTFKVKGEKHQTSRVKTLNPIDVELMASQKAFIDSVVTPARLEQGLYNLVREQLLPFEMTSMGAYIRWVYNDTIKEEADNIVANQYDPKKLGKPISERARQFFIQKYNEGFEISE